MWNKLTEYRVTTTTTTTTATTTTTLTTATTTTTTIITTTTTTTTITIITQQEQIVSSSPDFNYWVPYEFFALTIPAKEANNVLPIYPAIHGLYIEQRNKQKALPDKQSPYGPD
ncbi:thiol:disulfide interchange protein dsbd [Plakobranchus ocellatus]|uniref:Thiol:disulfide interchange protein dsbd n=1 Tax=Plakobranchus ocellatus TaxID=259542 RepID=A0AAV4DDV7_9GAST|nr:thiol:disulfide interchange protein dsbd [Plakobranchus ocellatus]